MSEQAVRWRAVGNIKGPPGQGATYEHVQSTPATAWTVNHGLSTYAEPVVLLEGESRPVYTDFEYVDGDTMIVFFPAPATGRVYVSN